MTISTGNWIRKDISFGVPGKQFILHARNALALEWWKEYKSLADDFPEKISSAVTEFVEKSRPELKGVSVIGMEMSLGGMRWVFWAVHPSFPQVPEGEKWPEERLETCPVCGKSLSMVMQYVRQYSDQCAGVEVCSKECVESDLCARR